MHPELFYTSSSKQAIPLHFVSQAQWEERIEKLTSAEANYFALKEFKGELGDCCCFYNSDGLVHTAYVGTGSSGLGASLAHAACNLPAGTYQAQASLHDKVLIHWALAQYRFTHYKKNKTEPRVLLVNPEQLAEILPLARAHFLVRDLINQPAVALGPKEMAKTLEEMAYQYDAEFKQWIGDELLQANFPAIYAVGAAAHAAPRLLSLTWGDESHPRVSIVGKGVCFDSGGLNIKNAFGMRIMKKDMGGAAHVMGLAQWIMESKLAIRLEVLIPTLENAIGPQAFRPGDVLTMRNGLTVEVDNTDAEGRLVLADALVKACEKQPDLLIDFATLTGAARVSVGPEIAAVFTNKDKLVEDLYPLAEEVSDPIWRLPLFSAYEKYLHSNIADLTNSSESPYAGAIVAALFLQRFIQKNTHWIHFDIMAWNLNTKPGRPEGGEAMGLRVMAEYLLKTYGQKKE